VNLYANDFRHPQTLSIQLAEETNTTRINNTTIESKQKQTNKQIRTPRTLLELRYRSIHVNTYCEMSLTTAASTTDDTAAATQTTKPAALDFYSIPFSLTFCVIDDERREQKPHVPVHQYDGFLRDDKFVCRREFEREGERFCVIL
jgi:hypothetical protein